MENETSNLGASNASPKHMESKMPMNTSPECGQNLSMNVSPEYMGPKMPMNMNNENMGTNMPSMNMSLENMGSNMSPVNMGPGHMESNMSPMNMGPWQMGSNMSPMNMSPGQMGSNMSPMNMSPENMGPMKPDHHKHKQKMYSLCQQHMNQKVKAKTTKGHQFNAFIDHLDAENVYFILLDESDDRGSDRAWGNRPGYGTGGGIGRLILPLVFLAAISAIGWG